MSRLYLSGRKDEEIVKRALSVIAKSPYASSEDRKRAYIIHQRLIACQDLQGYKAKKNRQQPSGRRRSYTKRVEE